MVTQPESLIVGSVDAVHLTQQEAGVGESTREDDASNTVFSGILCLLALNWYSPKARRLLCCGKPSNQTGTRFKGVIALNPGHAGVRCRPDIFVRVSCVESGSRSGSEKIPFPERIRRRMMAFDRPPKFGIY